MAVSWAVYAFVLYCYIVGSSLYRLFYPARCPYGPTDARCVHPLLPTGASWPLGPLALRLRTPLTRSRRRDCAGTPLDVFAFAAHDARWREPHALERENGAAGLLFAARSLRRGPPATSARDARRMPPSLTRRPACWRSPAERWELNVTLPFSAFGVRSNGTLFAHMYIYPAAPRGDGDVALPGGGAGLPQEPPVGYVVVPLTRHLVPRVRTAKRLLGGGDEAPAPAAAAAPSLPAADAEACAAGGGEGSCANPDVASAADGDADAAPLATPATAEEAEAEPWAGTGRTFTHIRPRVALRVAHPSPSVMPCVPPCFCSALRHQPLTRFALPYSFPVSTHRDAFPGELSTYLVHPGDPGSRGRGGPGAPPQGWPLPAGRGLLYRPLIELDDMSVTKRDFRLVSGSASRDDPVVPFALEPTGMGPFTLYAQLAASIRMLQGAMGLSEEDTDEMKEMISSTNIKWWILTTLVSLLHGLFSYLAFSNDVGFWRGKTSLEGLSIRSFFSSFVCQVIIFLKLLDSPSVSRIILLEVGVSVLVEGWKVSKIARRRGYLTRWLGGGAGDAPAGMTASEEETDAADARAMRWLSYGLYPCVAVWGAYSLYHHSHRSWWSWAVQTAAHGVYMWGFVAMTPQLYINYRLKSVAHLPWRALMYKTFNTFVDDVFAFAIDMPLSHRLACLRDDVVFFGYLYQRWIYPVDKCASLRSGLPLLPACAFSRAIQFAPAARANEFGRAYEEPASDNAIEAKPAATEATPAAATGDGVAAPGGEGDKKND